jgi:hypothetical protein
MDYQITLSLKEKYELIFEFEIKEVLKKKEKKKFIHSLEKQLSSNGVIKVSFKESHYILFKELDKARVFVTMLKVTGSIKNIIEACNKIVKAMYGDHLIHVEIFMKKGENYFARYLKNPNETGRFQIVKTVNVMPYKAGKIVICDRLEV